MEGIVVTDNQCALVAKRLFSSCPLCGSAKTTGRPLVSIKKDFSLSGFHYAQCRACHSFYLNDVTADDLDDFYSSVGIYESSTSKAGVATELAASVGMDDDSHVLDLGCGSGAWAIPLLDHCDRMTCVDLDPANLARLGELTPIGAQHKIQTVPQASLDFLRGCEDQSFDHVLCMFSLEHDTDPRQSLAEIHRVLRYGGKAVVLVPSADALQRRLLGAGFYWFQAPWHTCLPSQRGLRQLAMRLGFQRMLRFTPKQHFYSWFWIRGLADVLGWRELYNKLRNNAWFVKCDIAIDQFIDRIARRIGQPSYGFYVLERGQAVPRSKDIKRTTYAIEEPVLPGAPSTRKDRAVRP